MRSHSYTNQEYINALLCNDTVVLNAMYQNFYPATKRMVLHSKGDVSDASDIFQEALKAILVRAKAGKFLLTGTFEYYLYKVCKNKWMAQLKKKNRTFKELSPKIIAHYSEDGREIVEKRRLHEQRLELLKKAFTKLGRRSQELLILSWSGKPMKEVAIALNTTYSFARKSKVKIQKRLIAIMKQSPDFYLLKS